MAKPGKRKGSNNFQFRRAAPNDIWVKRKQLAALGLVVKREVTQTLKTSEPHEAKLLQAELSAEWDSRWKRWRETLASGPQVLDERQQWAVATLITQRVLDDYQKRTGERFDWKHSAKATRWGQLLGASERLAGAIIALVDRELDALGLVVTAKVRRAIGDKLVGYDTEAVRAAIKIHKGVGEPQVAWQDVGDLERAVETLHRRQVAGDFSSPEFITKRPGLEVLRGMSQSTPPFTFDRLFDTWETWGKGPDEKRSVDTVQRYRRELAKLSRYLKHDDPAMVTMDDAQEYLKHIKQSKPDGKTPAQKNLHNRMSILATLFAAGVKARKLTDNPFKDVIPAKAAQGVKVAKRRGFTDAEATKVLRAARREQDTWRRWGPWLMAYSGMRVSEAGQIRKQDLEIGEGSIIIHIRTEAGHVKNGTNRIVPVHAALVQEGFLAFVDGVVGERLFPQACLDRQGHRVRTKDGKPNDRKAHALNSWVRKTVGIKDKALDPNHAWRHRFRTAAQIVGMDVVATDRIVGHSDGHMRNTYLTDDMRGLLVREMAKFPALDVG